jgi:hypothetical protein
MKIEDFLLLVLAIVVALLIEPYIVSAKTKFFTKSTTTLAS